MFYNWFAVQFKWKVFYQIKGLKNLAAKLKSDLLTGMKISICNYRMAGFELIFRIECKFDTIRPTFDAVWATNPC